MLEMLDIGIDSATAFRIEGKISAQDMHHILADIRAKTSKYGQVQILQEVTSLGAVEWRALREEFAYLREVGFDNLDRVAVISDNNWLARLVQLEDVLFSYIDIRCFCSSEREQAISFLRSPELQ